ncbi:MULTISPECIES: hypothetical protein [unclassified Shewanella]|uniref:hypothetical protein n=1 Tax=unclassified Shewanella TaxID=196818 RepID=UPI00354E7E11
MNDYCIFLANNTVQVSRIVNCELEPIRIRGEVLIPLDDFWGLFKDKVEYEESESLAFMVLADTEDFFIMEDILIADHFSATKEELEKVIFDINKPNYSLNFYPEVDLQQPNLINVKAAMNNVEDLPVDITSHEDSLQTFFRKQTRAFQADHKKR